jgi:hypothetical protein
MVTGSVTLLADGRYDVRLRLWDIVRGQDLGGQSYTVGRPTCACRRTAFPILSMKSSPARKASSRRASPM